MVDKAKIKSGWLRFRGSRAFRSLWQYLIFVGIATLFWFVLAMNDNVQDNVAVKVHIYNVPDSVAFLSDPPKQLTVTVSDKGTSLFRNGTINHPELSINFKEYASGGRFRFGAAELYGSLRQIFGTNAEIKATSLDSICLSYTGNPPRMVPVRIVSDLTASNGNVIAGRLLASVREVKIYGDPEAIDTITSVSTERIVKRDLSQTTTLTAKLKPMRNVRIEPATIRVTVPVEPMVIRQSQVPVQVEHLPAGESLILFPSRVEVSYFAPLSQYEDAEVPITVAVDYRDVKVSDDGKLPLRVVSSDPNIANVTLSIDKVEYTHVE